jgi:hypothetical protein
MIPSYIAYLQYHTLPEVPAVGRCRSHDLRDGHSTDGLTLDLHDPRFFNYILRRP